MVDAELAHARLAVAQAAVREAVPGERAFAPGLRAPLPCWSAFTEGHVTAEGKLSACCFDATANWTMGDLTKTEFMRAWNSAPFVALREAHLKGDVRGTVCEKCVAYG